MSGREIREFPAAPSRVPLYVVGALLVIAVLLLVFRRSPEALPAERVVVQGPPDVIVAMHDLARLETSSFHVEKVIEITDAQKPIFGLVDANDTLLLVAVGDVVAGVDLEKLAPDAVKADWSKRTVNVTLPKPELFHASLDNGLTHVYARTTDTLAKRNEALESKARKAAEDSMREAAIRGGILDKARAQAERSVRATLRSLGFETIVIAFPTQ